MTDKIYALEHAHPNLHRHVCDTLDEAMALRDQTGGKVKVFVEEVTWQSGRPDHHAPVLVLYKPFLAAPIRIITASWDGAGFWVSCDRDRSRAVGLPEAHILGWQPLPVIPEQFRDLGKL